MDTDKENNSSVQKDDSKSECRACLQIFDLDENLVHLFQAWVTPWDGMGPTIAEDLAKIANIQVLETDRHSKVICNTCCQKLKEACVFTTIVQNNNILLKQRYPEEVTEGDKEWPKPIQLDQNVNETIFENHINVEVKQEVLSDEECGTNEMSEDYLDLEIKIEPEEFIKQNHILITAVNGAVTHNNSVDENPSAIFNGNIDLHEHNLDKVIKEEPVSEDEATEPPLDLPLECMLCTKSFNSVSGLKSHVIAQHSYKTVKRKTDSNPSPKIMKHTCTTCRRSFATSTDLLVHETCHNQYTCYGCNDKFETFQLLADHRLKCKQSNGTTVKHKSLKDVKRRSKSKVEDEDELRCTICNQQFSDAFYMNIHMEIHKPSEVKPDCEVKPSATETEPTAMEVETLEDIFTDTT